MRNLATFLAVLSLSCGAGCDNTRRHADAAELARITEWQLMVSTVRDQGALAALRQRADNGLIAAESALGQALVTQADPTLAREGMARLRRAATEGDAKALFTLGKLEFLGQSGVVQDYTLAQTHLLSAASQQEPRANYYLAMLARNGYGSPPDHAEAARQLAIAAAGGIPAAMFLLGNAYREGDGVQKDEARALSLYQQAAEHDHPESIQALAMAYQNGELGLPRDAALFQDQMQELAHAQKHAPPAP